MFTGIIEELGEVIGIEQQPDALKVLEDLKRGDSLLPALEPV